MPLVNRLKRLFHAIGALAGAFLLLAVVMRWAQLWDANGPILGTMYLPVAVLLFDWPYAVYAAIIAALRRRSTAIAVLPAVLGGLGLFLSHAFVWLHDGFGASESSTGALIYAVLPFYQAIGVLPITLGLGLLVQRIISLAREAFVPR